MFDDAGNIREDIAGAMLASITTMPANGLATGWNAGASMDDANFNRRQTIRVGAPVDYAQVGAICCSTSAAAREAASIAPAR